MNERIKELAQQAGWDSHHSKFDTRIEKFAELLVRECMDNLAWHGHDEAVAQLEWFKLNKLGIK